jgi:hypothetical protein
MANVEAQRIQRALLDELGDDSKNLEHWKSEWMKKLDEKLTRLEQEAGVAGDGSEGDRLSERSHGDPFGRSRRGYWYSRFLTADERSFELYVCKLE